MTQDVNSAAAASTPSDAVPPRPKRARIIGLDGVRGLLCLMIVVTHVTSDYSPTTAIKYHTNLFGFSLMYFFVLSGFLLSLPFIRNLVKDREAATLPDVTDYAVHRLARIVPAYLVIFLLVNFVLQISYVKNPATVPGGTAQGTGMITDPGMLIANLTLLQSYFPAYVQTGINPSWSLTLEYVFYASLPVFFYIAFKLRKRLAINPLVLATVVPAILILIGLIGRAFIPLVFSYVGTDNVELLNWGPNWGAVFTKSFLTNADNFAMGMLAAIVFVAMERGELPERLSRRVRTLSIVAILPVLLICGLLLVFASQFATVGVAAIAALMILAIVAPLARHQKSKLATALDFKPIRFVGEISLSAYLWHFPVLLLFGRMGWMAGDTFLGMVRNFALVLVGTLLLGSLTYYLVEKPAMNYAKRVRSKKKVVAPRTQVAGA